MSLPRILAIDDEPGFTRLIKLSLEQRAKKYEVKEVNESFLALEVAREFKPHLILLDLIMPKLACEDLIDQFRADDELKRVPIVIMEAFNSGDKRETSFSSRRMGGCPYISKPVSLPGLISCIDHYLTVDCDADAVRKLPPSALTSAGKYELKQMINVGGVVTTWKGYDAAVSRPIAVEVLDDNCSEDHATRLVSEAKLTGHLEHSNIVPVHDVAIDEYGRPFVVKKWIRGIRLWAIVNRLNDGDVMMKEKYPLAALLIIFHKVCDAVAFAHSKNVVHRNLGPNASLSAIMGRCSLWGGNGR